QPHPLIEVDSVLLPRPQAVEEVLAGQQAGVAVCRTVGAEVLRGAGEQQPVQGFAWLLDKPRAVRRGEFHLGFGLGTSLQRLTAERFRPPSWRVTEFATQETDHRVGDVELRRVRFELRRATPAPTRCSARSPTTFEEGVTF